MRKILLASALLYSSMAKELSFVEHTKYWATKVNEDKSSSWKATDYVVDSYKDMTAKEFFETITVFQKQPWKSHKYHKHAHKKHHSKKHPGQDVEDNHHRRHNRHEHKHPITKAIAEIEEKIKNKEFDDVNVDMEGKCTNVWGDKACNYYKGLNYCEASWFRTAYLKDCKKACNACPKPVCKPIDVAPTSICQKSESYCKSSCESEKTWMDSNCSKTCGSCVKPVDNGKHYDFYNMYPDCKANVLNQGGCGSCWAYSGVAQFSDRLCKQRVDAGNTTDAFVQYSPDPIIMCNFDGSNHNGCDGGFMTEAGAWALNIGIVTEKCWPFAGSIYFSCPAPTTQCALVGVTPACQGINHCKDDKVQFEVVKAKTVVRLPDQDPDAMMKALEENGPFQVSFTVYSDFQSYSSGVYVKTAGATVEGGHAVTLVGYGTEEGIKFWKIQNSWTRNWGEEGFFKIKRGVNECGIESDSSQTHF